jgi:hypothetical protein
LCLLNWLLLLHWLLLLLLHWLLQRLLLQHNLLLR